MKEPFKIPKTVYLTRECYEDLKALLNRESYWDILLPSPICNLLFKPKSCIQR